MASAASVRDAVQEALFRQFLAGSDPRRRFADCAGVVERCEGRQPGDGAARLAATPRCVEDMEWWRYDRKLAMWHCQWLNAYYDSGDRAFFRLDEVTQLFEPADVDALRELSARLRLELPPAAGEAGDVEAGDEAGADGLAGGSNEASDAEAHRENHCVVGARGGGAAPVAAEGTFACSDDAGAHEDGGWSALVATLGANDGADGEEEDLLTWQPTGDGDMTYWDADTGRMFLWQERAGVLYWYRQNTGCEPGACDPNALTARYVAIWSADAPMCLITHVSNPGVSQLVGHGGAVIGTRPGDGGWAVEGFGIATRHARVLASNRGHCGG